MKNESKDKLLKLAGLLGLAEGVNQDISQIEGELEKAKIRYSQAKSHHAALDTEIKTGSRLMDDQELEQALADRKEARDLIDTRGRELQAVEARMKEHQKRLKEYKADADGIFEQIGRETLANFKEKAVAEIDLLGKELNLERAKIQKMIDEHGVKGEACMAMIQSGLNAVEHCKRCF